MRDGGGCVPACLLAVLCACITMVLSMFLLFISLVRDSCRFGSVFTIGGDGVLRWRASKLKACVNATTC